MDRVVVASVLLLALVMVPVAVVLADESGSIVVDVANAPDITNLYITQSNPGDDVSNVDPNEYFYYSVEVKDVDTMADISYVYIRLEYNPSTDIGDDSYSFTERTEYWFRYRYDGTSQYWEWYDGSSWTSSSDYLDTSGCQAPSLTSSIGNFTFKVRLSKVATYASSTDWSFDAHVIDTTGAESSTELGINNHPFSVSLYLEYWRVSGGDPLDFGTVAAGQTDCPADAPIVIKIICNAPVDLQVKGTDLTDDNGHTLPISQIKASGTNNPTSATYLSTTYQTIISSIDPPSSEDAPTEVSVYFWLDVPDDQHSGHYTGTWYIRVVQT